MPELLSGCSTAGKLPWNEGDHSVCLDVLSNIISITLQNDKDTTLLKSWTFFQQTLFVVDLNTDAANVSSEISQRKKKE